MHAEGSLSPSMEDYLEAIYNLKVRSKVARVKDIAREMDVKMPSVTGAIRALAEKGLVEHQPYDSVDLTEAGLWRARAVAHRHSAIKEFLTGVLGLDEADAETEACSVEHAIRPRTLEKLLKFVEFVRTSDGGSALSLDDFRLYLEQGGPPIQADHALTRTGGPRWRGRRRHPATAVTMLSQAPPGAKGRIAFVSGRGPIRRRLLEMGLTPDTAFEVVRTAPLGDPIEIKVRGYNLSLRKSEANHVWVELT